MKQFLAVLESLITVILVIAGLAGLGYRSFRDGGWVSQGAGKVVDAYITHPAIAIGVTIVLALIIRAWRDRHIRGKRTRAFDYMVYVFMAAGIYFVGHYILTGNF